MCFVCRDLRECAPYEQSVASWLAAILKTVVYLLLGFTDCQLCSSAAVMDSRLVRIFVSVCDTQKMCSNWARNCRITLICLSHLSLFPYFFLSFFCLSWVLLAIFLSCMLSFLLSFFLAFYLYFSIFFISFSVSSLLCFLLAFFPSFILSPVVSFLPSFSLSSDLSENFCVSMPWFAANSSVVAS
jgi:hypothetical protein